MESTKQNAEAISQEPWSTQTQVPRTPTAHYRFPHNKLKHRLTEANKIPLVLVTCESFSPIAILHVQRFKLADLYIKSLNFSGPNFELVGSYLSPVSDAYQKLSLVPAHNRLEMCALAAEGTRGFMVDSWEALRLGEAGEPVYTKTIDVLKHFDNEINEVFGGGFKPLMVSTREPKSSCSLVQMWL